MTCKAGCFDITLLLGCDSLLTTSRARLGTARQEEWNLNKSTGSNNADKRTTHVSHDWSSMATRMTRPCRPYRHVHHLSNVHALYLREWPFYFPWQWYSDLFLDVHMRLCWFWICRNKICKKNRRNCFQLVKKKKKKVDSTTHHTFVWVSIMYIWDLLNLSICIICSKLRELFISLSPAGSSTRMLELPCNSERLLSMAFCCLVPMTPRKQSLWVCRHAYSPRFAQNRTWNANMCEPVVYCKSRIFRRHVIFVYFVRGGFGTKIKCIRKVQSKSGNPQRSATVRKFHASERSESPGYENWVRTKYSGFTVYTYT